MAKTSMILQKSLEDIKAGLWMCGDLCDLQNEWDSSSEKYVVKSVKPMACAVGLVSLHAGGKAVTKKSHWVRQKNGKLVLRKFSMATYPEETEWPKSALHALELLILAAPRKHVDHGGIRNAILKKKTPSIKKDGYDAWEDYMGALSGVVVGINDGIIRGNKKMARAWFERALKLAEKEENA